MEIIKVATGFVTSITALVADFNAVLTSIMIILTIVYTFYKIKGIRLDNEIKRKTLDKD